MFTNSGSVVFSTVPTKNNLEQELRLASEFYRSIDLSGHRLILEDLVYNEIVSETSSVFDAVSDVVSDLVSEVGSESDSVSDIVSVVSESSSQTDLKSLALYKTEICTSFTKTGACNYGERCQFAHGPQELRSVERHPKHKSKPCRNFSKTGTCPYGQRCCFLH